MKNDMPDCAGCAFSEIGLTLALLVSRILADHPYYAVPADDFAVPTHLLYGSPDFHFFNSKKRLPRTLDASANHAGTGCLEIGFLHKTFVLMRH